MTWLAGKAAGCHHSSRGLTHLKNFSPSREALPVIVVASQVAFLRGDNMSTIFDLFILFMLVVLSIGVFYFVGKYFFILLKIFIVVLRNKESWIQLPSATLKVGLRGKP
jgi:hypothetical protein